MRSDRRFPLSGQILRLLALLCYLGVPGVVAGMWFERLPLSLLQAVAAGSGALLLGALLHGVGSAVSSLWRIARALEGPVRPRVPAGLGVGDPVIEITDRPPASEQEVFERLYPSRDL